MRIEELWQTGLVMTSHSNMGEKMDGGNNENIIRKALLQASIALSWAAHHHLTEDDAKECLELVDAALDKPIRNCDIGTADEQAKRFEDFCLKHIGCADETCGRHCVGCPLEKASKNITQKCELYWAQMPY
jgi:hypothetical protein